MMSMWCEFLKFLLGTEGIYLNVVSSLSRNNNLSLFRSVGVPGSRLYIYKKQHQTAKLNETFYVE